MNAVKAYGQWHTDSGQFGGYRRQFVWHQSDMPGSTRKLRVGMQTWSLCVASKSGKFCYFGLWLAFDSFLNLNEIEFCSPHDERKHIVLDRCTGVTVVQHIRIASTDERWRNAARVRYYSHICTISECFCDRDNVNINLRIRMVYKYVCVSASVDVRNLPGLPHATDSVPLSHLPHIFAV